MFLISRADVAECRHMEMCEHAMWRRLRVTCVPDRVRVCAHVCACESD